MKWWKCYALVVAGLACIAPACAQSRDGNSLQAMCENSERNIVEHYVLGVFDEANGQQRANNLFLHMFRDKLQGQSRQQFEDLLFFQRICVPDGVTVGQLADISCKFLRDHPSDRHAVSTSDAIIEAIKKAFPCPPH